MSNPLGPQVASRRPVVVDLFAGAGGLSLGFEAAGYDVLAAVEYDPIHAATHLYNFPLCEVLCMDVRTVTADAIRNGMREGWKRHYPGEEWDGVVDVVVGGPSCQGFSVMGKQDAGDDRNALVLEFVRLVEQLNPRAFCMENVPGFLDPRFKDIRDSAIARLRAAGYQVAADHEILRAEAYGVPQRRRRVFILGAMGQSIPSLPQPGRATAATVDEAFAGLPELWRFSGLDATDVVELSGAASRSLDAASNEYLQEAGTRGLGNEQWGHARQSDRRTLSGCRLTVHSAESVLRFGSTPAGTKEPVSRFFKLDPSSPSLTLRAGTGRERGSFSAPRPLHPRQARVITVREAARLHSFPDWFSFHTTNWHGHRQIGNAVPPLLARHVASALLATLAEEPRKSTRPAMPLGSPELLRMSPAVAAKYFGAAKNQVPQRRRAEAAA